MFRTVTQQLSFLDGVVASVRNFSGHISQSYERQASAILRAGETFSASALVFLQVTVTRLMEQRAEALRQAERVLREALRVLKRIRQRRDQQFKALYETLAQVRTTIDGTHGRGTSDLYLGLEPDIVRAAPRVLLRYACEAIDVLIRVGFQLPATALKNTILTPKEYAGQIRPAKEALEATLVELEDQKRVTEQARNVRDKAYKASRKTIVYGSRFLEALYILAGEEYHAERLRPGVGNRAASDDEDVFLPPDETDPLDEGDPGEGEATEDQLAETEPDETGSDEDLEASGSSA